jgi:hypothetical protein
VHLKIGPNHIPYLTGLLGGRDEAPGANPGTVFFEDLVNTSLTFSFLFFFFFNVTGAWTQGLHLEPLHHLFFVKGFSR